MEGIRHSAAVWFAVLGFIIWLSPVFTVSCGGADPVISIADPPAKDSQAISSMVSAVNANLEADGFAFQFLEYSEKDNVVSIGLNMADYKNLGQTGKQSLI